MMGCTQSLWPLCDARISESFQCGLLGAVYGVGVVGLGDQKTVPLAKFVVGISSLPRNWADAASGIKSAATAAAAKNLDFMCTFPSLRSTPLAAGWWFFSAK